LKNKGNIQYSGSRYAKTIKIGKKISALQELGEKYSLDSKSILNKIKRSYFRRDHSKVLRKKSGSSADEIYWSSWLAYKHMLFILQGDEAREEKYTITLESLLSCVLKIRCSWWTMQLFCGGVSS
jgi:hypothetical protein